MALVLLQLRYTPAGNRDASSQLSDVRSPGMPSFTRTYYLSSKYLSCLLLPNPSSRGLAFLPTTPLKLRNLAIWTTIVLGSGIVTLSYLLDTETVNTDPPTQVGPNSGGSTYQVTTIPSGAVEHSMCNIFVVPTPLSKRLW